MDDENFDIFAELLAEYLKMQKIFIQNPKRMVDVNSATEIACKMFPDANIKLEDDPLQMGAIILAIEDFDFPVREPYNFIKLISKANNFEIIHTDTEMIRIAILFANALIRI